MLNARKTRSLRKAIAFDNRPLHNNSRNPSPLGSAVRQVTNMFASEACPQFLLPVDRSEYECTSLMEVPPCL
jgi:hypothetical protein